MLSAKEFDNIIDKFKNYSKHIVYKDIKALCEDTKYGMDNEDNNLFKQFDKDMEYDIAFCCEVLLGCKTDYIKINNKDVLITLIDTLKALLCLYYSTHSEHCYKYYNVIESLLDNNMYYIIDNIHDDSIINTINDYTKYYLYIYDKTNGKDNIFNKFDFISKILDRFNKILLNDKGYTVYSNTSVINEDPIVEPDDLLDPLNYDYEMDNKRYHDILYTYTKLLLKRLIKCDKYNDDVMKSFIVISVYNINDVEGMNYKTMIENNKLYYSLLIKVINTIIKNEQEYISVCVVESILKHIIALQKYIKTNENKDDDKHKYNDNDLTIVNKYIDTYKKISEFMFEYINNHEENINFNNFISLLSEIINNICITPYSVDHYIEMFYYYKEILICSHVMHSRCEDAEELYKNNTSKAIETIDKYINASFYEVYNNCNLNTLGDMRLCLERCLNMVPLGSNKCLNKEILSKVYNTTHKILMLIQGMDKQLINIELIRCIDSFNIMFMETINMLHEYGKEFENKNEENIYINLRFKQSINILHNIIDTYYLNNE